MSGWPRRCSPLETGSGDENKAMVRGPKIGTRRLIMLYVHTMGAGNEWGGGEEIVSKDRV